MSTRKTVLAALLLVLAFVTAGCGVTVQQLPLPKPGVKGGDSYTLHAVFANALNLPDQAKVKVGGSDVGIVTAITTTNFQANIEMKVRTDVQLPEGTTAELRSATPLGDVYVSMSMPQRKPGDTLLRDGSTIGIEHTSAGATVEELLLSATTLINGGALTQAAKIATEVNSIVAGKGPEIGQLITELTGTVGSLHERSAQLDGMLTQLNSVLGTVNAQRAELGDVATAFPQMLGAIAENNQAIGSTLQKLSVASDALGDFSRTSGNDLDALLRNTDQLMTGISKWGDSLSGAMGVLHEIKPKIDASTRGTSLAVALDLQFLSLGALSDPSGSRLPELGDINSFIVSFTEVLQHVYGRITGQAGAR